MNGNKLIIAVISSIVVSIVALFSHTLYVSSAYMPREEHDKDIVQFKKELNADIDKLDEKLSEVQYTVSEVLATVARLDERIQ